MGITIPWSAETEEGEVEFDLEVEVTDYEPGRLVTHLKPEDCCYEPGHIELGAAVRADTGEDIWPTMPAEERKRLEDAAWAEMQRDERGVA